MMVFPIFLITLHKLLGVYELIIDNSTDTPKTFIMVDILNNRLFHVSLEFQPTASLYWIPKLN